MRYISLFSGIEAATVAWEPLGLEPVAFSEIDAFPSEVLAHHFPEVPNLGDITKIDWSNCRGAVDIVVGGSPCQSFSVAGKREGLSGESGLMFEYIRAVRELRPRYFVWENVPGALSSEGGAAFGQLLREMDDLGYGLAWRVLDAQFFGVAQRRRRVFLVGCLGDARRAAEILFERESLCWDYPSSRDKRQALTGAAGSGAGGGCESNQGAGAGNIGFEDEQSPTCTADWYNPAVSTMHQNQSGEAICIQGSMIGRSDENGPQGSGIEDDGASFTLNCTDRHGVLAFAQNTRDEVRIVGDGTISGALAANPGMKQTTYICMADDTSNAAIDDGVSYTPNTMDVPAVLAFDTTQITSPTNGNNPQFGDPCHPLCASAHVPTICMADDTAKAAIDVDLSGTFKCGGKPPSVTNGHTIRRLMPVECERLQGFPDNWTRIPYKGKPTDECPDAPRYKALGNSMAVPVMRWIGERIMLAEEVSQDA